MTITHHLDDATIVALAAGTLGEAHRFVASAHVSACSHCRAALHEAEALGGALMADGEAAAVSNTCRSATLASLDGVPQAQARRTSRHAGKHPGTQRDEVAPSVSALLGHVPLDELPWKTKAPGVAMYSLPVSPGGNTHLQLLRIGPGRRMPEHGHGGEELTMVLRGSYRDHTGRFVAGDVADLDEETEHQPVVDSDVACICLVATEAPTRFKSFWARLVQPLIGM